MHNQTHNFLTLLGSVTTPEFMPDLIQPVSWSGILNLARAHNVYALIFDRASQIPEFRANPDYRSHMTGAMAQVADQTRRTAAFLDLYRAFAENGLYPIVMKGIICRQLYGEYCDHRPSGDEDILIQKEDYRLAERILKGRGYIPQHGQITMSELDDLQEVSFFKADVQLHVELHVNPIGHENRLRIQMNALFEDVFARYREAEINGVILHTMNHTDHFLFLVLHAFKHLMTSGFGIRPVLDILLYEQEYDAEINWKIVCNALGEIGALEFANDLTHIGNQYLGFSLPVRGRTNCPEDLLEDIMSSGAFGTATQAQRTAVHMTNAAIMAPKNGNKAAVLLAAVFPGRAQLLNHYPELQEKKWLLPVRWVQRWGRFLRHNRNNGGNLAKESMEISQRRIELLKKYKIL